MRRGEGREPIRARNVLIPLGIGLAAALAVFWTREGFRAEDPETLWRCVCDALTVPGVMLSCAGLLGVVSDHGAFDGVAFPARKALSQMFGEKKRAEMPKTYYDYVAARQEKHRNRPHTTLWIGLGFLALAVAALILYNGAA